MRASKGVRRALAGEAPLGALVSDHEALGPDARAGADELREWIRQLSNPRK